jgi:hypothetical protein
MLDGLEKRVDVAADVFYGKDCNVEGWTFVAEFLEGVNEEFVGGGGGSDDYRVEGSATKEGFNNFVCQVGVIHVGNAAHVGHLVFLW